MCSSCNLHYTTGSSIDDARLHVLMSAGGSVWTRLLVRVIRPCVLRSLWQLTRRASPEELAAGVDVVCLWSRCAMSRP